jgi:gliding-associated putative ABC transporter substrate-binding component GldG
MSGMQNAQKSAFGLLVAGSLVLLNVIAAGTSGRFGRIDLTRDKAFTLAEATRDTLAALDNPVKVTAYFTPNLPPPFTNLERDIRDLLEEYRAAAGGNLSFEFVDPQSQETEEDKEKKKDVKRDIFGRTVREKTSVETELESLGIRSVNVQVLEEDQAQTKVAYMALAVRYGEEKESIPLIQETSSLEYDLTTMIRRLVREKLPVVGIVQGHGEPPLEGERDPMNPMARSRDLSAFVKLLKPNYEVRAITIGEGAEAAIPDDVDALLIIGPTQPYSDEEQRAIDAFLMKGKAAAFFLDRNIVDFRTFEPAPNGQNLDTLVGSYGIELGSQLVGDVECASLSVQEQRGVMVINMPLKYPFVPVPKSLEGDSPMTRGIGGVTLPFVVPLYPKTIDGVEVTPLARSSSRSWLEDPTAELLNPRRDWGNAEIGFTGPYTLIAQARGLLPSFAEEGKKSASEARVILAGTATLVDNQVMGAPNQALLLNMVDWLSLDRKLLEMRARAQNDTPFHPELSSAARNAVKWGNVVGAPLLLIAVGLIRWQMREGRRRRLATSAPPPPSHAPAPPASSSSGGAP